MKGGKAANLEMNSPVRINFDNGKIVIEPIHETFLDLDSLLKAVTPENLHHEISTGDAVGNENGTVARNFVLSHHGGVNFVYSLT
jgi:antitoxin MazE